MKKSFQKSLIAASVGAVMFAAAGTASANSLLFPYFTTTSGAQSALSIVSNNNVAAAGETLHYVYNYGPTCIHFDGNGKVTNNDLLQHSVAAPAAGGFGKAIEGSLNWWKTNTTAIDAVKITSRLARTP